MPMTREAVTPRNKAHITKQIKRITLLTHPLAERTHMSGAKEHVFVCFYKTPRSDALSTINKIPFTSAEFWAEAAETNVPIEKGNVRCIETRVNLYLKKIINEIKSSKTS